MIKSSVSHACVQQLLVHHVPTGQGKLFAVLSFCLGRSEASLHSRHVQYFEQKSNGNVFTINKLPCGQRNFPLNQWILTQDLLSQIFENVITVQDEKFFHHKFKVLLHHRANLKHVSVWKTPQCLKKAAPRTTHKHMSNLIRWFVDSWSRIIYRNVVMIIWRHNL